MTDILRDPRVSRQPRDVLEGIVAASDPNIPTVRCPHCGNVVNQPPESCPVCNYDLTNVKDDDGDIRRADGTEPSDGDDDALPTDNEDPVAESTARSRDVEVPLSEQVPHNEIVAGRHVPVPYLPSYFARKFTQAQRDKAAKEGAAMSDGSFPIYSAEDVKNAVNLARTPAHRAHIIKRAKAVGATKHLPDNWPGK